MSKENGQKDLYVLAADQDMVETIHGLLENHARLGIRPINYAIAKHIQRDPGCRTDASQYLRGRIHEYKYALVVFDRNGCGDDSSREEIQRTVAHDLATNGWRDRSRVVVIDPELEPWIWNGSNQAPKVLGWPGGYERLKAWLVNEGRWPSSSNKPPDPKKALRAVLSERKQSVSSRLFGELARSITLRRCEDPAFAELKETLHRWFPPMHS